MGKRTIEEDSACDVSLRRYSPAHEGPLAQLRVFVAILARHLHGVSITGAKYTRLPWEGELKHPCQPRTVHTAGS